jgi:hypothetical protein
MGRDHLIISILTTLTVNLQINIKINKNRKKPHRYIFLLIDWWWFKFHAIWLSFVSPSKTVELEPL